MKFQVGDRVSVRAKIIETFDNGTIHLLVDGGSRIFFLFKEEAKRMRSLKKKSKPREIYMPTKIKTKTMWHRVYENDDGERWLSERISKNREEAIGKSKQHPWKVVGVVSTEIEEV